MELSDKRFMGDDLAEVALTPAERREAMRLAEVLDALEAGAPAPMSATEDPELASLVQLRRREPTLRGAFRIPLGTAGVTTLAIFPAIVLVAVAVLAFTGGDVAGIALIGGAAVLGGGLLVRASRRRQGGETA